MTGVLKSAITNTINYLSRFDLGYSAFLVPLPRQFTIFEVLNQRLITNELPNTALSVRKMRSQKQKPPTRRISSNYDFLGLSGQHITPKTAGRDYVCPKDLEVLFQEADYVSHIV